MQKLKESKLSDCELIAYYTQLKSTRKVGELAGLSACTINRRLRALGVNVSENSVLNVKYNLTDEEIKDLYLKGYTIQEISEKAKSTKGSMAIWKKLQDMGIDTSYKNNIYKYKDKLSKAFKKYEVDDSVFDKIDTTEKAYWLGFLMADGYNHQKHNCVALRLQGEDREILEKFKLFMHTNVPIYTFSRITKVNKLKKTYCEINITSSKLCNALANLGCIEGKTYLLEFPQIEERFYSHFIRGYFDGDGCISITNRKDRKNNYNYQFNIVGKESFLLRVKEILCKETGVSNTKIRNRTGNFAKRISWNGRLVCKRILDYLYKDATIYLLRKYEKYLQI